MSAEDSGMRKANVMLALVLALGLAGRVLAHEGHEHKMMGIVAAIDAKQIEITAKDEHKTMVLLDNETKYFRGKSETKAGDIKVGERVAITAMEKDGKMVAREVRLADNK